MQRLKRQRGFTLIEALVALAIVAASAPAAIAVIGMQVHSASGKQEALLASAKRDELLMEAAAARSSKPETTSGRSGSLEWTRKITVLREPQQLGLRWRLMSVEASIAWGHRPDQRAGASMTYLAVIQ